MSNNCYVYLPHLNKYGLIKNKLSDTLYLVKVRTNSKSNETEEIEVDFEKNAVCLEVEVSIRIVISEDGQKLSMVLKMSANEKLKAVAEELGEFLGLSKYRLTFFYKGEKVNLGERLGDKEIGGAPGNES